MTPTRIRPPGRWPALGLGELWQARELLLFLAARDLRVRYKQTALGVGWAVLQPLLAMGVFTVVFGQLAGLPSDGLPYPLFALAGLLPWQLFAYSLTQASQSLVAEQRLITKVYFPRLVVPLAAVLGGLADFAVAFALLLLGVAGYALAGHPVALGWGLLAVPGFVLLVLLAATAVGLWLSALNVQYRDVRYTLPFLTQLWLYASPIAYPSSLVPERWRWAFGLNPLAGAADGFRWAVAGGPPPDAGLVIASATAAGLLFAGGLVYFRRAEAGFADAV